MLLSVVLVHQYSERPRVEWLWVEVNQRVNYPVKQVLAAMEPAGKINMSDSLTRFCVSWTTINVIQLSIKTFIAAWNDHCLPGSRGGRYT